VLNTTPVADPGVVGPADIDPIGAAKPGTAETGPDDVDPIGAANPGTADTGPDDIDPIGAAKPVGIAGAVPKIELSGSVVIGVVSPVPFN
jgi:hypothetical protein